MHGRGRGEHMCTEGSLCKVLVGAINEREGKLGLGLGLGLSLRISIPLQTSTI